MSAGADAKPGGGLPPCPICGRPARAPTRPFCSARCADVDLGRWLSEQYRVSAPDDAEEDGFQGDYGPAKR